MKRYTYILLALVLSLLAVAEAHSRNLYGSGVYKKERRSVSGVKYVVNNSPARVIVKMGSKDELFVEGDDNLINIVNTSVSNNHLTVSIANEISFTPRQTLVVYVTANELKGLKVKSCGDIISSGKLKGNDLELTIDGAGDIQLANLLFETLNLYVKASGDIKLSGKAKTVNAEISGSGDINAKMVKAIESNVTINGRGDCHIFASNKANIKINGRGDVNLFGNPPIVRQLVNAAGMLHQH